MGSANIYLCRSKEGRKGVGARTGLRGVDIIVAAGGDVGCSCGYSWYYWNCLFYSSFTLFSVSLDLSFIISGNCIIFPRFYHARFAFFEGSRNERLA